ncbi:MAG: PKD domain-containing protein [Candidatus Zixiibacteriota bacterium]
MKRRYGVIGISVGALLTTMLLLSSAFAADNFCPRPGPERVVDITEEPAMMSGDRAAYNGTLRLVITEPNSRWSNSNYHRPQYHYAFIDWALIQNIDLPTEADTFETTVVWDASANGWSGIRFDNVAVVAALFDADWVWRYSNPPSGNPFKAYFVEAATTAQPGEATANFATCDYTHNVLDEEGTGTWCPYCVYQIDALHAIHEAGDLPFHYVALVEDKVSLAHNRCVTDYNLVGYPTSWFDGGYQLTVGGWTGMEPTLRGQIATCGNHVVQNLKLELDVSWTDPDLVTAHVIVTQGLNMNLEPAVPGAPSCPATGDQYTPVTITVTTTDPEVDDVYYQFDCSGDISGWEGPFHSGEPADFEYSFSTGGDNTVMVRAKDNWGCETAWSPAADIYINPNLAPSTPDAASGSDSIVVDRSFTYSTSTTDPEGDQVYYMWDCGDGVSGWLGPYDSGEQMNYDHSWATAGDYSVIVKSKDEWDNESAWSEAVTVSVFVCGDADLNGSVDIDDAVALICVIFSGCPLPPTVVVDSDCTGAPDIDDVVYLITYIFAQGPAPCEGC